jgi:2-amino-4-hydroxy-6-hydroxymethyldihydropteridine diphosphokinase
MNALDGAGRVVARSSLYRTEPLENAAQPPFVNAAAILETGLDPEALLDFLLATERRFGRDRSIDVPRGPRSLDLDLLLMDDLVIRSARLTLPHPGMTQRRFVLEPLSEIAPALRYPANAPGEGALGPTVAELLAALPDEGANRRSAVRKLPSGC